MIDPMLHLCCHYQGEIRHLALRERRLRVTAGFRRTHQRRGSALRALGSWLRARW